MNKLFLSVVLLLYGCADEVKPVKLNDSQKQYFGAWEHVGAEPGSGVNSDNMLLVFHADSSVSYKRCINKLGSLRAVTLPDAAIKSLTDERLVLAKSLFVFNWSEELAVKRAPYMEGSDAYFDVEGLKLRKLRPGERSTHESWKCGSDKD